MKKLLPAALLFICMHPSLFARPAPRPDFRHPFLSDTLPPIHTTLVSPTLPFDIHHDRPDRPRPAALSASPVSKPITIRIYNDAPTGNLSNMILRWELVLNGTVRQKGTFLQLPIAPKHSALFQIPAKIPPATGEAFLNLQYLTRRKTPQSPANFLIAEEQFLLRARGANDLSVRPAGDLSFKDEDGLFTISSPSILLQFDKQTGWLQHYEIKGFRLLEDSLGPKPNFWRNSPPGGDLVSQAGRDPGDQPLDSSSPAWQQATLSPHLQLFSTSTGSTIVIVRTEYTLPATSCQLHLAYTINASGEMQIEQSIETDSTQKGSPLPRFGMEWTTAPGLDSIAWYGKTDITPRVGIYHQLAGKQPASAIHDRDYQPPEFTGVRWWKLTGKDGRGLLITADSALLTLSALQYAGRDPAAPSSTQVVIDYPPFPLPYGNYHYSYKLTPLIPGL